MVAKGEDDKPALVPELILENQEEVKRFIEAMNLKKIRRQVKTAMDDLVSNEQVASAGILLKDERCVIKY
jgi:hypothetical protein